MKIGRPKVSLTLELYDKEGRLVKRIKPKRAGSFLKNFAVIIRVLALGIKDNIVDTGGVAQEVYGAFKSGETYYGETVSLMEHFKPMDYYGGDNDDTRGLVVGTGTTPPTPDDYAMEAKSHMERQRGN